MKYERSFNFSAGPAMMPEPVLEEIRDEMMNYRGSGMCVMERSRRSNVFAQIAGEGAVEGGFVVIHQNIPFFAAAVGAVPCDAAKSIKIGWFYQLHNHASSG